MKIEFKKGFAIYRNGPGPVYVCPHSGPALETPTSRDDNSDTVASLCWMKTGGTLIISGLPRKRLLGIDFNRSHPKKKEAVGFWPSFLVDENRDDLTGYRKKYSWVAVDDDDHDERSGIYRDFWESVNHAKGNVVFIHRKFPRLKNFPSILDVITYQGQGVDKETMENAISKVNKKHQSFFARVSNHYKSTILLEEMRAVDKIQEMTKGFSLHSLQGEYRENILGDLNVIERMSRPFLVKRLRESFNPTNFIAAIQSALDNAESPKITLEAIFRGDPAKEEKQRIFASRKTMELESNSFLNYWYPEEASQMIVDIMVNSGFL
ncbi:MAG: hypothetical protein ABIH90_02010 [Candidatus Aenigmatarchaeota archaeon]